MNDLILKLPLDIILLIIPYTYQFQNKNLLIDIKDYQNTRSILLELYYKYSSKYRQFINEPDHDKYWLINDIFAYANNYKATMYGFTKPFYTIFKRNVSLTLKTEEFINKYIINLEKKKVNTQINIFLGLFTISERNDLITAFCNKLH